MHHFVVPPEALCGDTVAFPPDQGHQIARVLRLRSGDEVIVLDGRGGQYRTRLVVHGARASGTLLGPATECHEPRLRVTLLVAPPRGERWEWLLQKGTEVGVAHFVPVIARYSQPGTATVKPRHHVIVREAAEQCRRLLVPSIAAPQPLAVAARAAAGTNDAATILLWEGARDCPLPEALRPALEQGITDVRLIIGPEGGLHPAEVALAQRLGIPPAGLGPLILRTETAGPVAAAIALALDGERAKASALATNA
jgi:16S rRNA (uracil1498-N3)-methyltransferase